MVTETPAVVGSPAALPAAAARHVDDIVDDIDDEFFALVYSDQELLRDEFDALMAAAWSEPPTPARGRGAEHRPGGPSSDLPTIDGRLPLPVGAGRRTLAARIRAPPDITDGSPSPHREREEGPTSLIEPRFPD